MVVAAAGVSAEEAVVAEEAAVDAGAVEVGARDRPDMAVVVMVVQGAPRPCCAHTATANEPAIRQSKLFDGESVEHQSPKHG